MSERLNWTLLKSERIADCKVFSVNKNISCVAGKEPLPAHAFYVLHPADWVNVIPITAAGEVLLIKQFRHGICDVTLEIPGGMVDQEDSDSMAAAMRELREETGYTSQEVILLGRNHPNPAIQSNVCHTYLALNCESRFKPQFDSNEYVEICPTPIAEIPQLIQSGTISHALVIVAFHYLELYFKDKTSTDTAQCGKSR